MGNTSPVELAYLQIFRPEPQDVYMLCREGMKLSEALTDCKAIVKEVLFLSVSLSEIEKSAHTLDFPFGMD